MIVKMNPQSNPRTDRLFLYCRLVWNNRNAGCDVNLFRVMEVGIDALSAEELHYSAVGLHGNNNWMYTEKEGLENYFARKTNGFFYPQDGIIYNQPNCGMRCDESAEMVAGYFLRHESNEEKRCDCTLVVLSLVVKIEGFIKSSIRCLKREPDLFPLILKTDDATNVNIHSALPACRIVNVIDWQFKGNGDVSVRRELRSVMNAQQHVTTDMYNDRGQRITVGHRPKPEPKAKSPPSSSKNLWCSKLN